MTTPHPSRRRRLPTSEEISDLQWLLAEIDRLPGCARTKEEVRRLLRQLSGHSIYFKRSLLVRDHEVAQALAFLSVRTVAQTREALMEHARVSRRKAYYLIERALEVRAAQAVPGGPRQMGLELEPIVIKGAGEGSDDE